MQLNPKQEEAKNQIDGPLLIIAGAGSGKTATLTARVEYMIKEKGISPSSILMITFTNKAGKEMKERMAKTLGVETPKNLYSNKNFPLIGTFHSVGIFILKEVLANFSDEELNIGLKKDFVIYDEQDKISILRNIIKERLKFDEKTYPAKLVATYISNAKNAMISAKQYEAGIDSKMKDVVFKVYSEYEKILISNNAMDFDDILLKVYRVLNNPKILEIYQERYRYIMVDEYQDTNLVQYRIIKLLASKYRNLAVVGDDAQSIYSWRGANMQNIIDFKKDYPDALIIKLEQNYRSTKKIISGANSVISKNHNGIKKELWTDNDEGKHICYIEAPDDKTEAKIIVDIIKASTLPVLAGHPSQGEGQVSTPPSVRGEVRNEQEGVFRDNLILYRTNAQSRVIEEALLRANIPYRVVGGMKFYDRAEIKDLLAYLKAIYNPNDVIAMKRIINKPTRKIGEKSIEVLDIYREKFDKNYLQIIENIDEVSELNNGAKMALKTFLELYKNLVSKSKELVVADLLKSVISLTNYEDFITEGLPEEEKQSKKDNIDELINVASEYNGLENSLSLFLEEIALITDLDTKDERTDYVVLMTIHTSKGLEEHRVFITGLEDGLFPSSRSLMEQAQLEEERRLMYVAMTRAKEELYISRALERFQFGEFKRYLESRFIKEIPSEFVEKYEMVGVDFMSTQKENFFGNRRGELYSPKNGGGLYFKNSASISASLNNQSTEGHIGSYKPKVQVQNNDISQFLVGNAVFHPKFGNGVITEFSGEIASISFPGNGVKKMNVRIAPIRKID